ncbi:threonine--tRNA ligase, partial [Patescibacteria group bacterium]|nr:threonine--tRNA ligase [Patescibacteria group bacterium]
MPKQTKIEIVRHSLAHILAAAVQKLYPEAKFGIGPIIENGFYYDIDFGGSEQDLPKIEKAMRGLIQRGVKFEKEELNAEEAIKLFKKLKQPYKVELIQDLEKVTIYKTGDFTDLCLGPHVSSTKEIKLDTFKLTKIAGAYWRGDEK